MILAPRKPASRRKVTTGKVLVVEDNLDQWSFIRKAFEKVLPEIQPVLALNSQKAVEWLEDCSFLYTEFPQLILLDLYLPRREDGWQTLEQIKAMPTPVNQLPVIMLSSSTDQNDITEAYRRGIQSYVIKPTVFDEWLDYFEIIKDYWWEAAALPKTDRNQL